MHIRVGSRAFRPSIFATLLTLTGCAAFVALGLWQLGRADEKRVLATRYEAGAATTVDLDARNAATLARYQRVRLRGRFDNLHQILLDNMPSQHGRPGYRVITPLALEGGGWILVDRGWLASGATRNDVPAVDVGSDERTLTGRLDEVPRPGLTLETSPIDAAAAWPRVMNYPSHAEIERALGRRLLDGLVLLDPDQADGYERSSTVRLPFGAERHIAYAVQWFAFAVAAVVIYMIVSLCRKE